MTNINTIVNDLDSLTTEAINSTDPARIRAIIDQFGAPERKQLVERVEAAIAKINAEQQTNQTEIADLQSKLSMMPKNAGGKRIGKGVCATCHELYNDSGKHRAADITAHDEICSGECAGPANGTCQVIYGETFRCLQQARFLNART